MRSDVLPPIQCIINFLLVVTLTIIIFAADAAEGCFPSRQLTCGPGEYPYYFGTQTFNCNPIYQKKQIRFRRAIPHRFTLVKTHRLLKYKGWVFDYWDAKAHVSTISLKMMTQDLGRIHRR